jgi:outer membrane protein OmpA-like peptidoglycan-associated protein
MDHLSNFINKVILFFFFTALMAPGYAQTQENNQDTPQKMTMEVVVTDYQNNPRQGEEIVFVDTSSKEKYSGITNEKGMFVVELPGGSTYHVKIKGISEEQTYQVFSIPPLQKNKRYGKSRYTIKYRPAEVFTLDNVYFDVNKAKLRADSYKELNELVNYLERKKHIRIEIAGHTDNVGSEEANQKLSQQRAESVKQYLVSKGIDAGRIEAKGYGESKPVADNNSKEGKQKNRRTEVHIISD